MLSMEVLGKAVPLPEFPVLKNRRGLGMTDDASYASLLAEKFDYTNTSITAMARIFRHVTGVDVSAEMIERAKVNLSALSNVTLILGDGATLSTLKDASYDFGFSFIVFQHIPSAQVVASYCREVYRVLRPGALFKFQVQGAGYGGDEPRDTWQGISFSENDTHHLCQETGFMFEWSYGVGTQYYWLWFRKPYG
jgi:ubiquinone/menaquinone biosynthesis C-methylase UbiE